MTNVHIGDGLRHEGKPIKESEFKWFSFWEEMPSGNRPVVIQTDDMDWIVVRVGGFPPRVPKDWYVWAYLPDVPPQSPNPSKPYQE